MTNNTGGVNLQNRDPNNINDYLQVEWDDVIAEPDGTSSVPCIWTNSYKVFTGTKNCCYKALTIFCAFPIALAVGISFACLTFQHIWCVGPALRHCRINCFIVKQYMRAILDSCLAPCCSEVGLIFSRIRYGRANSATGNYIGPPDEVV